MATGTSLRAAVVAIVIAASWTASHRAAAAADALIANPRTQPITITASDLGSHSVALGVGKSVVIDLPHDIKDVLVGDPKIANAVIRSARRAYIVGNGVGQTNVYFFDAEGRQMAGFDIAVTRDLNGIRAAIRQVLPEADIRVEGIGEGVVLSGTASSQAEAQQAYDIAVRLLGAGTADTVSLGSKVVNAIIVRGRDQIMLKVTVAEVERDIVKQLGINLSGTLGYGTAVVNFNNTNPFSASGQPLSSSAITGGWQNISATMQAMEQVEVIHTLAEPNLTAISGETAAFVAGGEFPVLNGFSCTAASSGTALRECSVGLPALDPVQEVRREPQLHAGSAQRGPHQPQSDDRGVRPLQPEFADHFRPQYHAERNDSLDPHPPRRNDCRNSFRRVAGDGRHDPERDQAEHQRPAGPDGASDSRTVVQEPRLHQPADRTDGAGDSLRRARRSAEGPVAAGRRLCRRQRPGDSVARTV